MYIKEGVTKICKDQIDYNYTRAKTVVLPNSIQTIDQTAFNFAPALESIVIPGPRMAQISPSLPHPGTMLTRAKFYVPNDMLETYRGNQFWSVYANKIVAILEDGQR